MRNHPLETVAYVIAVMNVLILMILAAIFMRISVINGTLDLIKRFIRVGMDHAGVL